MPTSADWRRGTASMNAAITARKRRPDLRVAQRHSAVFFHVAPDGGRPGPGRFLFEEAKSPTRENRSDQIMSERAPDPRALRDDHQQVIRFDDLEGWG